MNKQLTLIIDIDNVIYPFTSVMEQWVYYNKSIPNHSLSPVTRWEVWEDWNMPKGEWNNLFRKGVEEDFIWSEGEPIKDSVDALWRLSDSGHYVRLVTHRLVHKFGHAKAVIATASWLDKHNIPYRDLVLMTDKSDINGDVMLDDNVDNVLRWQHLHPKKYAFLFDAPHNQDIGGLVVGKPIPRIKGWKEFLFEIKKLER